MTMRRLLGSVVPAVLLVALPLSGLSACGDDEGGTVADDPASTASQDPSDGASDDSTDDTSDPSDDSGAETGQEVDHELVEMITETAAGGATSPVAVPLGDDEAVQAFNQQFETDAMPTRVQDAVAATEVPDDMLLYGAVVSIGCDAPTDVTVTDSDSGLVITAMKVPHPQEECFAAMTTVALVLVPASAV
jgi:hypothetical protein